MIQAVVAGLRGFFGDIWSFLVSNFDPFSDTIDILLVAFGIYWLLLLIRGTRAVQILVGLLLLIGAYLASQAFGLQTVSFVLDNFLGSAVIIIIVLFQADIRRALARVGRGFFPSQSARQESQLVEEVVRAAQTLAQKRVGALFVLGRETGLDDLIEAGTPLDAAVSKEILVSIFLPYSPLHDGAVVIQDGRIAFAGSILPLTLRADLPEGLGTRHRAALGITEESDAVVVVVSEETASISVVVAGQLISGLEAPQLRVTLRDLLTSGRREPGGDAAPAPTGSLETPERRASAASAADAGSTG
ncbi:MAG TPA: diadenylate cyclase CdaA [Myxococcota bacterium]|nr:diadenylate cyclase CdaA [Myxococcota bacterium]